jgi:hypothetical protein
MLIIRPLLAEAHTTLLAPKTTQPSKNSQLRQGGVLPTYTNLRLLLRLLNRLGAGLISHRFRLSRRHRPAGPVLLYDPDFTRFFVLLEQVVPPTLALDLLVAGRREYIGWLVVELVVAGLELALRDGWQVLADLPFVHLQNVAVVSLDVLDGLAAEARLDVDGQ